MLRGGWPDSRARADVGRGTRASGIDHHDRCDFSRAWRCPYWESAKCGFDRREGAAGACLAFIMRQQVRELLGARHSARENVRSRWITLPGAAAEIRGKPAQMAGPDRFRWRRAVRDRRSGSQMTRNRQRPDYWPRVESE